MCGRCACFGPPSRMCHRAHGLHGFVAPEGNGGCIGHGPSPSTPRCAVCHLLGAGARCGQAATGNLRHRHWHIAGGYARRSRRARPVAAGTTRHRCLGQAVIPTVNSRRCRSRLCGGTKIRANERFQAHTGGMLMIIVMGCSRPSIMWRCNHAATCCWHAGRLAAL